MRMRIGLCLALSLWLTACSGGLVPTRTPVPTSTPRLLAATRTPLPTLTPAATASPGPTARPTPLPDWSTSSERSPEFAAGLLGAEDRERYARFITALRSRDETAADWLAHTGLFLRDARLDALEVQTMNMVLGRKDDPLWYLTHARTLDGISEEDWKYLDANSAIPGEAWFFDDDIQGLQAFELLSGDGRRSLQRAFDRAHEDMEVRKGLYLINTLGLPDSRGYKWSPPLYNVPLYLLARLLEQGLPAGYERAAVAAALTYGSLATLCDQSARDQIIGYAVERTRLVIETDVLLAAAGARWRSTGYSLEMLMTLLWAGQSSAYPEPGIPLSQVRGLRAAATARPLGRSDLARILVPVESIRQMQDEMMRAIIERAEGESAAHDLLEQWWGAQRRDEPDEGGPDMNRQWLRYRSGRGFAGGTEAGYVLQALGASINLAVPWAQLWYAQNGQMHIIPFGLRVEVAARTLRLSQSAAQALSALPADTKVALVVWRAPWDNWHGPDAVRGELALPMPIPVWRAGIPSGYLLRYPLYKDSDIPATLGIGQKATLAPTATERK